MNIPRSHQVSLNNEIETAKATLKWHQDVLKGKDLHPADKAHSQAMIPLYKQQIEALQAADWDTFSDIQRTTRFSESRHLEVTLKTLSDQGYIYY